MPTALNCIIREDAMPALKRLRAQHLAYIQEHLDAILFGGPARAADGTPQEMMIVLKTDDSSQARQFIEQEPYTASGEIFAEVKVRAWSQVVPEANPGSLAAAIAEEHERAAQ